MEKTTDKKGFKKFDFKKELDGEFVKYIEMMKRCDFDELKQLAFSISNFKYQNKFKTRNVSSYNGDILTLDNGDDKAKYFNVARFEDIPEREAKAISIMNCLETNAGELVGNTTVFYVEDGSKGSLSIGSKENKKCFAFKINNGKISNFKQIKDSKTNKKTISK
jgi:hypothetical protein